MRHRKSEFKVGRRPEHARAMVANQVCSLIIEEQIKTTVTKAKEVRRAAEKAVTLGKKGTLAHRRLAISRLGQIGAVHKLFEEVAPRYLDREGGYTRIIRIGQRRGDSADMCILEWVESSAVAAPAEADVAAPAEATPAEVSAESE